MGLGKGKTGFSSGRGRGGGSLGKPPVPTASLSPSLSNSLAQRVQDLARAQELRMKALKAVRAKAGKSRNPGSVSGPKTKGQQQVDDLFGVSNAPLGSMYRTGR